MGEAGRTVRKGLPWAREVEASGCTEENVPRAACEAMDHQGSWGGGGVTMETENRFDKREDDGGGMGGGGESRLPGDPLDILAICSHPGRPDPAALRSNRGEREPPCPARLQQTLSPPGCLRAPEGKEGSWVLTPCWAEGCHTCCPLLPDMGSQGTQG